jgi:hypothetical protein
MMAACGLRTILRVAQLFTSFCLLRSRHRNGAPRCPLASVVKTLADEVDKGGIAAWKALRDLLPRDEDIPSGSPSMSFSQLFIAAHKEINSQSK